MVERRSPSRLAGSEGISDTPRPEVRFIRVPSIAERKLGTDYVAPMRLDPRVLEQMQSTIRDLEAKYADALKSQVAMLQVLVEPARKGDADARERLYALSHDMRVKVNAKLNRLFAPRESYYYLGQLEFVG